MSPTAPLLEAGAPWRALAPPLLRVARQAFSVLARNDGGPWRVRLLLTGGRDGAAMPVQIDLSPARADMLAQELMQMADLARNPERCPA